MAKTPVREIFDAQYYQRFYHDPKTRAASVQEIKRRSRFVASYLKHIQLPVSRILDMGCGLGHGLKALGQEYPRAKTFGVEYSQYLCEHYGWEQGSAVDYKSRSPFDLVVCFDVIQYLDKAQAAQAIDNLAALCRGALYLSVLTKEDWLLNCDRQRTDPDVYLHTTKWYRKRLQRQFVNLGGGLYLRRPAPVTVWALDCLD